MKKKFLTVALAATMVLSSVMTAFAEVPAATWYYGFEDGTDLTPVVNAKIVEDADLDPDTKLKEDSSIELTFVDGVKGKALAFNGLPSTTTNPEGEEITVSVGNYGVKLNNVGDMTDTYTVNFWLAPYKYVGAWQPFVTAGIDIRGIDGDEHWINITYNGTVAPFMWSRNQPKNINHVGTAPTNPGDGYPETIMPTLKWSMVTISVDASKDFDGTGTLSTGTIYLDGKKIGETQVALGAVKGETNKMYVGVNPWDPLFLGQIDELSVWVGTALDEAQVTELYGTFDTASIAEPNTEGYKDIVAEVLKPSINTGDLSFIVKTEVGDDSDFIQDNLMLIIGAAVVVVLIIVIVVVALASKKKKTDDDDDDAE